MGINTNDDQGSSTKELFGYTVETNVVYGQGKIKNENDDDKKFIERDLLLDIYTPANDLKIKDTPQPAVILVHGGGFQRGGLRQPPYREDGAVHSAMEDYAHLLAPLGYNCFVREYRLSPEYPKPKTALDADWLLPMEEDLTEAGMRRVNYARSMLDLPPLEGYKGKKVLWKTILSAAEDLKTAVEYVKRTAKTYNTDPNKIALGGHSAGAATVINAAFGLDVPVNAIFPLSPPVSGINVTTAIGSENITPTMIVMSQNDEPSVMEKVPAITEELRKTDCDFELVWVPDFPHFYPHGAVSLSDDGTRTSVGERIIGFLEKHLG